MNGQKSNNGRQLTVAGVMAYTAVWALIITLFRQAVKLRQGTHTINEARLSETLILIANGLLFVAIGLLVSFVFGRTRQAVPISLGCFFVGFIAIPILFVVLVTLAGMGVINLDL